MTCEDCAKPAGRRNGWYTEERYGVSLDRSWFDSLEEAEKDAKDLRDRSAAYWGSVGGKDFAAFEARPFEFEVWSLIRDTNADSNDLGRLLDVVDRARGAERNV